MAPLIGLLGCHPVAPGTIAAPTGDASLRLEFVGDLNVVTGTVKHGLAFGGLSALSCQADGTAIALSDDGGENGPPRWFGLQMSTLGGRFTIETTGAVRLGGSPPLGIASIDLEGIARVGNDLWVESEGALADTPLVPPSLHRLSIGGAHLASFTFPPAFMPASDTTGLQKNRTFEGLTTLPNTRRILFAAEGPRRQDSPTASVGAGATVILGEFDTESKQFGPYYAYRTDPIPTFGASPSSIDEADLGVSEILAIGGRRVLVLERASVSINGHFRNRVRLYVVQLPEPGLAPAQTPSDTGSADDLEATLVEACRIPMAKTLVADFDTFIPKLTPPYRRLDNFEGMCLGPKWPDGTTSLVVVSDNNFRKSQRTAFWSFRVHGID